jgi:hypothetical protein
MRCNNSIFYKKATAWDCELCGLHPHGTIACYQGQDEIGLICVNTSDVYNIAVGTYDVKQEDADRNRSSTAMITNADNHERIVIDSERMNQKSRITVYYTDGSKLDYKRAQRHLCSDCIYKVQELLEREQIADVPVDTFLIDFATKDLYPVYYIDDGKEYSIRDEYDVRTLVKENELRVDVRYIPNASQKTDDEHNM